MLWTTLYAAFATAFALLFPIVNPIGSAILYSRVTHSVDPADRRALASRIGMNVCIVLIMATWAGSLLLNFFGIGIGALRVAGGLIISHHAWMLLAMPEVSDVPAPSSTVVLTSRVALIPLTIPFTVGPGSLAAAITIGSLRPSGTFDLYQFIAGSLLAECAIALIVGMLYASADRVVESLGESGARAVTSLSSLLLLCIGVQLVVQGRQECWVKVMPATTLA